jgi:hypothetical protein
MINSVAFFDLTHEGVMNWALAIGFELGAAASLAAIIILDKTNKTMVWSLFLLLTGFQMMANSFHAFVNLENYMPWIELFGLEEEEPIFQKRILSVVSGAVLPLVALGFIKSLVDYIRPSDDSDIIKTSENVTEEINDQPVEELEKVVEESSNIVENTKDDVIPKIDEAVINSSRISKTDVHHVERVPKSTDESLDTQSVQASRKHYISKP